MPLMMPSKTVKKQSGLKAAGVRLKTASHGADVHIAQQTATSFIQYKSVCACGGGCPRCAPVIQPKLIIGKPDDIYEQEADRVAEEVMRMPEPQVQRQEEPEEEEEELLQTKPLAEQITPLVQRQIEEEEEVQGKLSDNKQIQGQEAVPEEEEPETVQTKQVKNKTPRSRCKLDAKINTFKSGGKPLPKPTRNFFEERMGSDFSQVRIHDDSQAADAAKLIGAKAFTMGKDVAFGEGQYKPETKDGKELLAHELAHTIQQSNLKSGFSDNQKYPSIMRSPEQLEHEPPSEHLSFIESKIPNPSVTRTDQGILATVYFGQNSFLLDARQANLVEQLSDQLRLMPNPTVIVDGYASTEGSSKYNMNLSIKRRQLVIALLRSKLIGTMNFQGEPYGESKTAMAETAKEGSELETQRAQNRRAVIWIMPTPIAKPTKLINLSLPIRPPTAEERLENILKEPPPPPLPKKSISEMAGEKIDNAVEDILSKVGVPREYREMIKKGARSLAEKGLEKALDTALDQAPINDKIKKAIKESIRAVTQIK